LVLAVPIILFVSKMSGGPFQGNAVALFATSAGKTYSLLSGYFFLGAIGLTDILNQIGTMRLLPKKPISSGGAL
jgi:hypothetical protein